MVKHIVTFRFRGDAQTRRRHAEEFKAALEALPEKIDVLRSIDVGINENPGETWDIVLTAIVDSLEDVAVYSSHPAHVAAAAIIAPVKESRACVDYSF